MDECSRIRKDHVVVDVDGTPVAQDVFVHDETGLDVDEHTGTLRTREETEALIRDVFRVGRDSLGSELERYEKWMRQGSELKNTAPLRVDDRRKLAGSSCERAMHPTSTRSERRGEVAQTHSVTQRRSSCGGEVDWEEVLARGERWKLDGNARLQAGDARQALRHYGRALAELQSLIGGSSGDGAAGSTSDWVAALFVVEKEPVGVLGSSSKRADDAQCVVPRQWKESVSTLVVAVLANRAQAELSLRRWDDCQRTCRVVRNLQPDHVKCWFRYGMACAHLGSTRLLRDEVIAFLRRKSERSSDEQDAQRVAALSQLRVMCRELLPDRVWRLTFRATDNSSDNEQLDDHPVDCSLITFAHNSGLARLRFDVDRGAVVARLPCWTVPWDDWFHVDADEQREEDSGRAQTRTYHPTEAFVAAFATDDSGVASALSQYLSAVGHCPCPATSRRNIQAVASLRELMDRYLEVDPTRGDANRRARLFPVLLCASCILGVLDVEEHSDRSRSLWTEARYPLPPMSVRTTPVLLGLQRMYPVESCTAAGSDMTPMCTVFQSTGVVIALDNLAAGATLSCAID